MLSRPVKTPAFILRYNNVITFLKRYAFSLALLAGIPALAAMPAYATVQTHSAPGVVSFDTQITELYGSLAPYQGRLDLHFSENGTISGYFRPVDTGSFIPVTGGRNGNDLWFDIGNSGRFHFTGTLSDGRISGGAIQGNSQYKLSATQTR